MSIYPRTAVLARGRFTTVGARVVIQPQPELTVIMKNVVMYGFGGGTGTVGLYLNSGLGGSGNAWVVREQLQDLVPIVLDRWVVLMPPDYIVMDIAVAPVDYWISGAVLHGVDTEYEQAPAAAQLPNFPSDPWLG